MQTLARTKLELLPTKTAEFHTALNILQGLKLCLLSFERTVRILLTVCLTSASNLEGLLPSIPVTFHFTQSQPFRKNGVGKKQESQSTPKTLLSLSQSLRSHKKRFLNA